MRKKLFIPAVVTAMALMAGCGKPSTLYYNAGMNYLENGQYEQAVIDFGNSLKEEAKTKECYRAYGISLLLCERYDEAAEAFLSALRSGNSSISSIDYDINDYLARAYSLGGHFEEAADTYTALITLKPKESTRYYYRGLCYLYMGDLDEAAEDFALATNASPDDYDLHLSIFNEAHLAGYDEWGYKYLEGILTEGSRKISDYDRGRLTFALGDYSNARVYLEKAKDMANPDTVLMLGKAYEALSDYNYAASLYNTYLNSKAANSVIYNQLGVCRMSSGDYESALSAFTTGLIHDDGSCQRELLFNQAVAYEFMQDYNTSYEKFQAYLKLYPRDEAAMREIEFLSTRRTN